MTAEKQLYNSRVVNNFVCLLRKKYPQVDINELLLYAEMTPYEVTDEGHWFTQSQVNSFHDKLDELLGFDISREAGRYSASGESLGQATKYIMGMISPSIVFSRISKSAPKLSKSTIYTSKKLAENKVEITVTPVEGVQEMPFQCENRMGFFEAALVIFDYNMPTIEHPECMFQGDARCRYVVTWKRTLYSRLRAFRNALLFSALAALVPFHSFGYAFPMLSVVAFVALASSYVAERLEKRELVAALVSLKESSHNLVEQVETNYNNARMVNEVGQAISKQSDIEEILENFAKALENRLRYDRCAILLADSQQTRLKFRTGFGYSESQLSVLKETSFNLSDPKSTGVFVVSFREQRPILVNDFSDVSQLHSARSVSLSEQMQAQSFICCPIVCEGESLGILAVDNVKSKKRLVQSDMTLLMGMAPVIGMSIRNAMYIERERRMAEQLRHSQKMEAVGQLAGGVAHDFNNLLTAIIGFANLAEMSIDDSAKALNFLEQVQLAADRATLLTQGLLAFSRKQVNNPQPVDLNAVIDNIKKLLCRLITAEIELEISPIPHRLQVMADVGQVEQILMNLVTNARDAISGPGVVTIRTGEIEMSEEFVQSRGFGAVGRYALLSVCDTGTGMDEATKNRIFEPFFTTKEVGKGTGLGMSIIYGIVQQHQGYLEAESELGVGTSFHIYLPLLQQEVVGPRQSEACGVSYRGKETVLVAEDAAEVRRLTTEVLQQNGYRVIEAVDGQDAVDKFSQHSQDVDLVIMDVVMPKLNGKDAFLEIAKINPQMKVLFTSGYTPDDVRNKGVTFSKENFLPKPASPQVLLKKVREALAA